MRDLLGEAPDLAVFTVDDAQRVSDWPPGAERLLGLAPAAVVGRAWGQLFPPAPATGVRLVRGDGTELVADLLVRPLPDGRSASCHAGSLYTDSPALHDPSETGMDPAYAARSATGKYRTTPLRALWQHAPYFHDGSAATLADVVRHYDSFLGLGLSAGDQSDLVEFLRSL